MSPSTSTTAPFCHANADDLAQYFMDSSMNAAIGRRMLAGMQVWAGDGVVASFRKLAGTTDLLKAELCNLQRRCKQNLQT